MCYIGGRDSQSFHHPRAAQLQRRVSQGLFICRCAAELISRLRREISSALPGRENFSAALRENFFLLRKNSEAPKPFRFRGFIYPGSYLLSRDLSSDYHRRADVSLPGSEWDRVGPSGYDHQASALLRTSYFSLSGCHLHLRVLFICGLAAGWHPRGLFCAFVVVHSLRYT